MFALHKFGEKNEYTTHEDTKVRCMFCHAELWFTKEELENYYIQYDIRCKHCDKVNNYEERNG